MHIESRLTSLIFVTQGLAEEQLPNIDNRLQNSPRDLDTLQYDRIFIKFDPDCLEHADVDLYSYFNSTLSRLANSDVTQGRSAELSAFASLSKLNPVSLSSSIIPQTVLTKSSFDVPDAAAFGQLLTNNLAGARNVMTAQTSAILALDSSIRETETVPQRRLGAIPRALREDDILSAFHLLAASELVGVTKVGELLKHEETGNVAQVVKMIQQQSKLPLSSGTFAEIEKRLKKRQAQQHKTFQEARIIRGARRDFTAVDRLTTSQMMSVIMDAVKLPHVDVRIIDNPFLGSKLLLLADLLPCLGLRPESDRLRDPLDVWSLSTVKVRAKTSWESMAHTKDSESSVRSLAGVSTDGENLTTTKSIMSEQTIESVGLDDNQDYQFVTPNDNYFHSQWYLRGENQGELYGAQVLDGWSALLRDRNKKTTLRGAKMNYDFNEYDKMKLGMPVAVLDSGCSRHVDLVSQFWRNPDDPTCKVGVYVGQNDGPNSTSHDCIGYDFGNESPDPTSETRPDIHGSSTSGIIAAEGNNFSGIVGVCPGCKIVCLKVYDTTKSKIRLTSIIRAIEYMIEKGIKLSNHSYGGFGISPIELAAHRRLADNGHLSICSSGNNGCNIDEDTDDPNACITEEGLSPGPYTPANYDLKSIISVGASSRHGTRAEFSNYGKKSVDIFAPGQEIATLFGPNDVALMDGTSFSAPIVTGIVALLWSHYSTLSAEQVKTLLLSTGRLVPELEGLAKENRIASLAGTLGSHTARLTRSSAAAFMMYNLSLAFYTLIEMSH